MVRRAVFAPLPLLLVAACSSSPSDPAPPATEPPAKTVDLTSGWQPDDGRGKVSEDNVELWIKKPQQ